MAPGKTVTKKKSDPFQVIREAQQVRDDHQDAEAQQRSDDRSIWGGVLGMALDIYGIVHPETINSNHFSTGGFDFEIDVNVHSGRAFLIVRPDMTEAEQARVQARGEGQLKSMPFYNYFEILTQRQSGWGISPSLGFNQYELADLLDNMKTAIDAERARWKIEDDFAALPAYASVTATLSQSVEINTAMNERKAQGYRFLSMTVGQGKAMGDTPIYILMEKVSAAPK